VFDGYLCKLRTCAIDTNGLYLLTLLTITQIYQMITKLQLLQSATAIGMAIGTITIPAVIVRANPAATSGQQSISAPQPVTSAQKPRRYGRNSIALGAKVDTVSGSAETALAEYLVANDVKFYGSYSCSHCQKQKSLFGAAAAAKLPYIECAPDGENSQRQLCKEKNIQMFPTWVIKGKYFPGTRDLKEIATMSGYQGPMDFKYQK
jgi:glutaredoxin